VAVRHADPDELSAVEPNDDEVKTSVGTTNRSIAAISGI
jgi:hypothetical protein